MRSARFPVPAVVILAAVTAVVGLAATAAACTRAVYLGPEGQTVTGRSMDWQEDMHTNLWIFPRGMARDGGLDAGALEWKSRYGSVVASVYEGATADGMNEKGLVANILYLAEPVRAGQLRDGVRGGGGSGQGRVPPDPDRRADRRAGDGASVGVGPVGGFGDLRIPGRQADHPPRP